jgi:hypothetical protein
MEYPTTISQRRDIISIILKIADFIKALFNNKLNSFFLSHSNI